MILFKANGRCAAAVSDEKITSGSVGIQVTFQLSEVYDDLAALAVFRGSGAEATVILPEPVCTVPPEVLAEPGGNLLIGVYARDGEGTIAVPTVWADAGRILGGATPDLPDTPATPDWTAQVELAVAEAVERSEEALEKASAVEEEGARQVQAVQAAGDEALDAIETGKTAATEALGSAQAAAVQAVQTESTAQQAAVQAKGEEVLESIPADYTALSGEVDDLKSAIELENVPFPLVNFATTAFPTGLRNGRWNTSGASKATTLYTRTNKSFSPTELANYSQMIISSEYTIQYYWSTEGFPYGENEPVTGFGYGGDYASGPITINIDHEKYYAFSLNVRYTAETAEAIAAATTVQLVPAGTRVDDIEARVEALETSEVTSVATLNAAISAAPNYSIPSTFHTAEKIITDDDNMFNRIQGICSDGRRYLYYCLLNASGLGLPCKFDTWTRKRVAINDSQEHDYGHCESLCYVPAWMPGFDSGNVDRIYIVDLDRTTTSSGLVHVVSAEDLSYITSFATDTLPPASIIGDWWAGADHVWCCPERGEFAVESVAEVEGSTAQRHNCIAVYDLNGNLLRATKFIRTNGTEFDGDCDPNFILLGRYTGGDAESQFNIYEHMLDWNLNPVRVAQVTQAAWEVEGMCHIGQDVYCAYIEDSTAKGASIYRYTHINTQHPANQVFPVQTPIEWAATSGFPLNSFEAVEIT